MKLAVVFGTIGLGFLLLILSTIWTSLFPATDTWTDEKAQRSAEVKARLAYVQGTLNSSSRRMHSGPGAATLKTELDALIDENEKLNAEFESAAESPQTVKTVLKWSGITLAALGIIGWYATKEA